MDDKEKLEQLKEGVLKPDEKLQKFDDLGLTDDYLIGKLKDQCEAEREIERRISKKEVKLIKIPLWKIQQDAVKEANKLKGNYPAEKHEHTGDVIFHSNVPEPDMPKEESPPPPPDELPIKHDPATAGLKLDGSLITPNPEELNQLDGNLSTNEEIKPPEWVKKEEPTPDHDQDKEFKDHHRSRREDRK